VKSKGTSSLVLAREASDRIHGAGGCCRVGDVQQEGRAEAGEVPAAASRRQDGGTSPWPSSAAVELRTATARAWRRWRSLWPRGRAA
jgi:hypothetical protein